MTISTTSTAASQPPPRLIRASEVRRLTGLPRSSMYAMIRQGKFPKPVPLTSHRSSAWLESEVQAWITERIAARTNGEAA